ncbi:MAG: hypothetical protein HYV18_09905 [Gammaproteobacteria bacterium]|nr:hypothetical protein [Gammaproteobacteria bacterium]
MTMLTKVAMTLVPWLLLALALARTLQGAVGDHVYTLSGSGIVACVHARPVAGDCPAVR